MRDGATEREETDTLYGSRAIDRECMAIVMPRKADRLYYANGTLCYVNRLITCHTQLITIYDD